MRFHSDPSTPPPYFNKRDQRRLLLIGFSLLAVVYGANLARKPEFWRAMFPEKHNDAQQLADGDDLSDGDIEIDTGPALRDDEIFSELGDPVSNETGTPGSEPVSPIDDVKEIAEPKSRMVDAGPIDIDLLADVRDNTLGIRSVETHAYHALLARARDAHKDDIADATRTDPGYAVLMTNPDRYRGEPVQIEGRLRRVTPFESGQNRFGLENLYDAWLFTRDSGSRPYHVVATDLAAGIPIADQFDNPVPVRVNGYFFKLEGYAAQGGLRTAPLILAKSVDPVVQAASAGTESEIIPWLFAFAILVGGSLLLTLWGFFVSDWKFRFSRTQRVMGPPATVDFSGVDATDIDTALREMSAAAAADSDEYA